MTITEIAPLQVNVGLDLRRLSPHLGAEVTGVDLCAPMSDAFVDLIRGSLVRHKVLFFRDQDLDPDSQRAFAERFGALTEAHPVMEALAEDHPEIWQIDSSTFNGRNDIWHTDVTFVERPPLGSILRAVRVPQFGGDTNWADLEAAYRSLSPGLQRLADSLTALHDGEAEFNEILREKGGESRWEGQLFAGFEPVEHPVVRVHPETGRKSLFVNRGFTTKIVGVSEAESRHLLDIFFAAIEKPENTIRHHWQAGDVVFWDNRSTAHYANDDYGNFRRIMHRITIRGDKPKGVTESLA